MKRLIAFVLALLLGLSCAGAEDSPAAAYEAGAWLMMVGDYDGAAESFWACVDYADALEMAIYCWGLHCAQTGDYAEAVTAFEALPGFKDSALKATYYTGVAHQTAAEAARASGVMKQMEAALTDLDLAEAAYAELTDLPGVSWRLVTVRALREQMTEEIAVLREAHRYDYVTSAGDGCFLVRRDGMWGVIDAQGDVVHPFVWPDGLWDCSYRNMKLYGDLMMYVKMRESYSILDDCWIVTLTCHILDGEGKEILNTDFKRMEINEYGIWVETPEGVHRGYSRTGEELTTLGEAWLIAPDRALRHTETGWALQDASGTVLYEGAGDLTDSTVNGDTVWVMAGGETLLLTLEGEELLRGGTNALLGEAHMECAALTAADGTVSVYDSDGQKLFDSPWEKIAYAGEGLFAVRDGDYLGFVDMQGNEVIPCTIESGGFAPAFEDGYMTSYAKGGGVWSREGECFDPLRGWERKGNFVMMENGDTFYGEMAVFTLSGELVAELELGPDGRLSGSGDYFAYVSGGVITICDAQGNIVY